MHKLHFTATIHGKAEGDINIKVLGREAWALLELIEAGAKGCTPGGNLDEWRPNGVRYPRRPEVAA